MYANIVINNHHCLESEVELCLNHILKKKNGKKKEKTRLIEKENQILEEELASRLETFDIKQTKKN